MSPAGCGTSGLIFDIDSFAVHDGPGIRLAVYFKGCPLRCRWCHSPESQSPIPELILIGPRCVRCGRCAADCPAQAHEVSEDAHVIDRTRCKVCGQCVGACPAGALALKGATVTAGAIVEKASRLAPFFRHSGGGVTLTGGEITLQPEFAEAILNGCRRRGIHTAIETCGACDWGVLERLANLCDLVLLDLKLINEQQHRHWTGASNRQILENARRLRGRNVTIRLPLIPGITDTPQHVAEVAGFTQKAGLLRLTLLPYNASAAAKYEWLGRQYEVHCEPQPDGRVRELLALARGAGLEADVG
jgi:pyruvate formate lyase activating enzyme